MIKGIEKAAERVKFAEDTPIITDLARVFNSGRRLEVTPEDISALRLGGAAAGGLAGGVGGGLAGLLGHYVAADEENRRTKDYLRSMLLGGGLGTAAGATGGGWTGGRFAEEIKRINEER